MAYSGMELRRRRLERKMMATRKIYDDAWELAMQARERYLSAHAKYFKAIERYEKGA